MKNISLQLQKALEPQVLRLLAGAASVAATQGIPFFVVGASARDLVLEFAYGVPATRATTDVDLAIAVGSWADYQRFFEAMTEADVLKPVHGISHRYEMTGSGLTVDIVPFGEIENPIGTIAWPPGFETRMTVTGFKDAHACAWTAEISPGVSVKVASLHGLAFLKLLAWRERRHETKRDGVDLAFIIRQYGSPVMQERLGGEAFEIWERENFDTLAAGARLLGEDMGSAMSKSTKEAVLETINHELSDESGLTLAELIGGAGAGDIGIERGIAQLMRLRDGIVDQQNPKST